MIKGSGGGYILYTAQRPRGCVTSVIGGAMLLQLSSSARLHSPAICEKRGSQTINCFLHTTLTSGLEILHAGILIDAPVIARQIVAGIKRSQCDPSDQRYPAISRDIRVRIGNRRKPRFAVWSEFWHIMLIELTVTKVLGTICVFCASCLLCCVNDFNED